MVETCICEKWWILNFYTPIFLNLNLLVLRGYLLLHFIFKNNISTSFLTLLTNNSTITFSCENKSCYANFINLLVKPSQIVSYSYKILITIGMFRVPKIILLVFLQLITKFMLIIYFYSFNEILVIRFDLVNNPKKCCSLIWWTYINIVHSLTSVILNNSIWDYISWSIIYIQTKYTP